MMLILEYWSSAMSAQPIFFDSVEDALYYQEQDDCGKKVQRNETLENVGDDNLVYISNTFHSCLDL